MGLGLGRRMGGGAAHTQAHRRQGAPLELLRAWSGSGLGFRLGLGLVLGFGLTFGFGFGRRTRQQVHYRDYRRTRQQVHYIVSL